MKKQNIKYVVILVVTILICNIGSSVQAVAGSFSVNASASNIDIGATATVSITVNNAAGKFIASSSDSGVISINSQPDFADNSTVSFTVKALKSGSATISVLADDVTDYEGDPVVGSKSVTINVKEPTPPTDNSGGQTNPGDSGSSNNGGSTTKSSNNFLSSLTTDTGTLSPKFSKNTTSYSIEVGKDVEKVNVTAKAEDSKASVSITGNTSLKPGNNTCKIVVTAENGNTKTYTLTIKKEEEKVENTVDSNTTDENTTVEEDKKLGLEKIEILNSNIKFNFDINIYEYEFKLKEDITKLDIVAIANIENAIIEILGNEDLQIGENVITIFVKLPDGSESATYQLIVNKDLTVEETNFIKDILNDKNKLIIAGGTIAGAIVIIVASVMIVKKSKASSKIKKAITEDSEDFGLKNEIIEDENISEDMNNITDEEPNSEKKEKRNKKGKH